MGIEFIHTFDELYDPLRLKTIYDEDDIASASFIRQ